MNYPNFGTGWEIAHTDLPVVQIICRDENFEEYLTVHENLAVYQTLHTVLDECERAYVDWLEDRA